MSGFHEPFQDRDEQFQTYLMMRKERYSYSETLTTFRLKYILALSMAMFGFTGIYAKLNNLSSTSNFCVLVLAWIFAFISILLVMISFHMSIKHANKIVLFEENKYLYNRKVSNDEVDKERQGLHFLSILTDASFIIGILFFLVYFILK